MKRLGAYACIAIFIVSALHVLNVPKVSAQGIDRQTESGNIQNPRGSYEYYQGVILGLHNAALAAFTANASRDTTTLSLKAAEGYKNLSIKNYDAYLAAFNAEKTRASTDRSSPPADAQIKGIQAWVASRNEGNALVISQSFNTSAPSRTAYEQYGKKVQDALTAAIQIKAGYIDAGSAEAEVQTSTSTIGNASLGNTNKTKQVADDKPDECSLLNGNLVGCINTLITWLIKNTILQVGGFLVWLTANMLNYAIQISILDFSKWAPASLYPIWVIIRQIVSLFVVFAGLYLGFMYIIGRAETFSKYIGWLVVFALFVNFSYPFSRALVDISNIVSLNVYSAAVGSETVATEFSAAATTLGANTAGAQIMNRLGLAGLVGSATTVGGDQSGFVGSIRSMPGALVAVAFVFYAAYIFFMATAIIAVRTAVLVFLTVASPLLLVDAVVPKLGEAAVKMRKMFFEQLIVAPVFMIMLALTLKFMEVFQTSGALRTTNAGALTGTNGDSIQTFFSILMMLIMLHIMIKVTKEVAGSAGEYATGFMGKVGGFGLGMATGGAGMLARGSVGSLAARARDSGWMDKIQGSKMGRGMYGLTNSLAQSTYDVRNVGLVSSTMSKAGLTGMGGLGMQKGIKEGFDARKKSREEEVSKFGSNIRDDATRSSYFSNVNNGRLVRVDEARMRETEREVQAKRDAQMAALAGADSEKRKSLIDQAVLAKDYVMTERLKAGDAYLNVKNTDLGAADQKAEELRKMGMSKEEVETFVNKKDPFADLQKVHEENIKQMERSLATMKRGTDEEKKAYSAAQAKIGETKKAHEENIENLRKATLDAYSAGTPTSSAPPSPTSTQQASTGAASGPAPVQIPAVQRAANANFPPRPSTVQPSSGPSGESANQSQNGTSPARPSFVARPSSAPASGGALSNQIQGEPAQNVQPSNRPTIEPGPSGTYTFNGVNYASYPDATAARRVHLQTNNMTNSGMSPHGMPSASPSGVPVAANKQAEPVVGAL